MTNYAQGYKQGRFDEKMDRLNQTLPNINTVEEIVKSYFSQSEAMGYVDWSDPERVYIDGYFNLQGMIEELTQPKEDELREVYLEILDLTFISKTHIEALALSRGINL